MWGQTIRVHWAEPERVVDEGVMQQVKVLYASLHTNVRSVNDSKSPRPRARSSFAACGCLCSAYLPTDPVQSGRGRSGRAPPSGAARLFFSPQVRNLLLSTTEETLRQAFSSFRPGCVQRVKKLSDYAFVHYFCREDATKALALMHGAVIDGASVEVMLAKPAVMKERNSRRTYGRASPRSGCSEGGGAAAERDGPLRAGTRSPVSSPAGSRDREAQCNYLHFTVEGELASF